MFQILTQKGWAVVMYEVMFRVNTDWLAAIIAIYFILYHLYATVVNIHYSKGHDLWHDYVMTSSDWYLGVFCLCDDARFCGFECWLYYMQFVLWWMGFSLHESMFWILAWFNFVRVLGFVFIFILIVLLCTFGMLCMLVLFIWPQSHTKGHCS